MSILFKRGLAVTAKNTRQLDIRVEGEKIVEVGENLLDENSEIIDATGCFLFPGFIDGHTHLDMDTATAHTADDFSSGSRAAIAGGTTCVIDFATQDKGSTMQRGLDDWHKLAKGKSSCDYAFHMAITDWNEETAREMPSMFAQGIRSFKIYMAYDALRLSDGDIFKVMESVHEHGGMLGCHCENGDLVDVMIDREKKRENMSPAAHPKSRPSVVEAEAVERFLTIAALCDLPVNIVHLSCHESLEYVRQARGRGQKVYVETCPHYLLMDESKYVLEGFESGKYVCSPPLRSSRNPGILWEAIQNGEVDTISTDHCSFNFEGQKTLGKNDFSKIPNGLPGVEHRPALLYTYGVSDGKISENEMVLLMSENIAKQFGLYPQKGALEVGSDADIVIWDPSVSGEITAKTQHQNVDYTPYEGVKTKGVARDVFLRGKQIVKNRNIISENQGKFIACK